MPISANATRAADLIVPEVWADMVQGEFTGRLVWGGLAQVFTDLEGVPGDTIHFPRYSTLTDAVDVTEDQDLPVEKLATSDDTATVKEAGKAVEVSDRALLNALGDPLAEARRQLGVVIARKIDADLQADVLAEPAGTKTTTFSLDSVSHLTLWSLLDLFGEDGADPANFAAFIMNSARYSQIRASDYFNRADSVGQGNQAMVRGYVGNFASIPVVVSDRLPAAKVVLIEHNSLGLIYKRRPIVETDRDILARSTVITTNVHYGTKVIKPAGVAVATGA
ncbi:MAG: N4-gp56 family major capsid protein [Rubrobacteraceae bacterium]|nr:N4-gp56 family major capsid protein [Rubrobacteraceae bacterium]